MPDTTCSVTATAATSQAKRHTRQEQVAHLHALLHSDDSQRAYASRIGVPSTTLRDWVHRQQDTDADPQWVRFFESPAGLLLLHRIFVAALLVMKLQGSCGLRRLGQFFKLSGLSSFLASSYGPLQQGSATLHSLVADFGQQQCQQLGKTMPHKRIIVCEDETFPVSGMTLVAMEPVSGFLLAEQVAEDRTEKTWNALFDSSIANYDVEVIAQCSDEAKALRAHADAKGLPHCPDLFHVLHDINGALVLHLSRLHRGATHDATALQQVICWQETRERAVKSISDSYHPYELCTGSPQSMGSALGLLDKAFCELEEVACQSSAPSPCIERLAKARRVVPLMALALADYHDHVQQALDVAEWPENVRSYVQEVALPAAYLRRVSASASTAQQRAQRLQRSEELLAGASALVGSEDEQRLKWVQQCVGEFCRGSSCVEGRNGVLAQREHAHRCLLPAKRAALTVAHNFLSVRDDGSTAAQRFFEQPHPDLFEWVLQRMPVPPRPAASRAKRATPIVPVA